MKDLHGLANLLTWMLLNIYGWLWNCKKNHQNIWELKMICQEEWAKLGPHCCKKKLITVDYRCLEALTANNSLDQSPNAVHLFLSLNRLISTSYPNLYSNFEKFSWFFSKSKEPSLPANDFIQILFDLSFIWKVMIKLECIDVSQSI